MYPFDVKQNESLVSLLIQANEMDEELKKIENLTDEERNQIADGFANLKAILQTKIGEDCQSQIAKFLETENQSKNGNADAAAL